MAGWVGSVFGEVVAVALWDVAPSRLRTHRHVKCLVSSGVMMRTDAPTKESVPMINVSESKMLRIMNVFLSVDQCEARCALRHTCLDAIVGGMGFQESLQLR